MRPPLSEAENPAGYVPPPAAAPSSGGGFGAAISSGFKRAFNWIIRAEGSVFENHPADPGGATKYGIIQTEYTEWRRQKGLPVQSVAALTEAEAARIYFEKYWSKSPAPGVAAPKDIQNPALALVVFDTAVNPRRGVWQYVESALNNKTASVNEKIEYILGKREELYRQRVQEKPSQSVFLKGWLNRISLLRKITLGGGDLPDEKGFFDIASDAVYGERGDGTGGLIGGIQSGANAVLNTAFPMVSKLAVNIIAAVAAIIFIRVLLERG